MKKVLVLLAVLTLLVPPVQAVGRDGTRSVSDFTGDNISFALVSVTSSPVVQLAAYSTSRGALTCLNVSSNTVYLGTSTVVTAAGATSFPLPAGQSIQFRNNAGIYGVVAAFVGAMTVGCITEW